MLPKPLIYSVSVFLTLVLFACSARLEQTESSPVPLSSPSPVQLTPYHTVTPLPSLTATRRGYTPTPIPTLTPTPRSYTVIRGDDMFGIALRHGISLEVLLTANPTVDPNFLSIGTELIIPAQLETPDPGRSTATPIPLDSDPPICYPTGGGGMWCFLLVRNPGEAAVEDLTARFRLVSDQDGTVIEQAAAAPLDILPGKQAIAIPAYFPPPAASQAAVNAQLETAHAVPEDDQRYLPVEVDHQVDFAENRLSAQLQGTVRLPAGTGPVGQVWVVAVAYGELGEVVGVRKWVAPGTTAGDQPIPFAFNIYSLGPQIERVEILVQARP